MGDPGAANPFMAMMNAGIWDMPMVTSDDPAGSTRDGTIAVEGAALGYRLYLPLGSSPEIVVVHFHGNAEVCGDADNVAAVFTARTKNPVALLSVDYRGYGWSTGQPSLRKLCADAERVVDAVRTGAVAGLPRDARIVCWGRSIGALSACHLAAHRAGDVYGLIVDSGLMSILSLPMVRMLAGQLLGGGETATAALAQLGGDPVGTLPKLARVACPAVVMHALRDEIVPFSQGQACHDKVASLDKTLVQWPAPTGHNDCVARHGSEWTTHVNRVLDAARVFPNATPAGAKVETHSLSAAAFNGQAATVLGPAPASDPPRLRVRFQDPSLGEKALKVANLRVLQRRPL